MRNHLSLIILLLLLSLLACSNNDRDIEYSDATIERIQVEKVWELNGGSLPIEQSFYKVGDLEVDTKGNIYVADFSDRRIKKFSPEGEFITTIGRPGQGPGEFGGTFFMELDARDNLYVRDGVNGRVSKFSSNGNYIKALRVNYIGYLNDFEIKNDKIFFSNRSRTNSMLVETDTTLQYKREIVPIPKEIRKDVLAGRLGTISFTVLPNSNFMFFNNLTRQFYEITYYGKLQKVIDIKYKELEELILRNEKLQEEIYKNRRKKSNIVIQGSSKIPIFARLDFFFGNIYAMYNEIEKFGNSLDRKDILYIIDIDGNFLKECTGFKNSWKRFTIDNKGYIYAMDWFLSKVCKYQIPKDVTGE